MTACDNISDTSSWPGQSQNQNVRSMAFGQKSGPTGHGDDADLRNAALLTSAFMIAAISLAQEPSLSEVPHPPHFGQPRLPSCGLRSVTSRSNGDSSRRNFCDHYSPASQQFPRSPASGPREMAMPGRVGKSSRAPSNGPSLPTPPRIALVSRAMATVIWSAPAVG